MKVQRDKLQQYQKRIKVVTDRETEVARECLRQGHKDKALLALRRRKYQESLLMKTDQQLAHLQALTSDVEFALVQKDVVFGLQQGTAVLKEIHKEMGGLEKVELIMSETEEAQAYQNVSWRSTRDLVRLAKLTNTLRKSTTCSVERCQPKTKTQWKSSSLPWKGRPKASRLCLRYPLESRTRCPKYPQTIRRRQARLKTSNQAAKERHWQPEGWTYRTRSRA